MKWLLSFVAAVVIGLIGRDAWEWLPRLSRAMIWAETLALPRVRRNIRREEWVGELVANYDDRRFSGFIWTLRLGPIAAWEGLMFRRAYRADRRRRDSHEERLVWLVVSAAVVLMVGSVTIGIAAVTNNPILPAALLSLVSSALWVGGIAFFEHPARRRRKRILRRVRVVRVLHELNHEPAALSLRESKKLYDQCIEVLARAGREMPAEPPEAGSINESTTARS